MKKTEQASRAAATSDQKTEQKPNEIVELTNDLQRTRADFENFRKQVDARIANAYTSAEDATITKILPLLDDFSRAIQSTPDLKPLEKTFAKTLKELGLSLIDSTQNTDFNPDLHEAVMMADGDGEREVIVETLRPGYFYRGVVLRPAMVKVGRI